MRSIVLEVLRDGPAHNQLLSPLTKYLALCGEHAAISMQLGFEHAQWLARMGALSYRDSEQTRALQLADVSTAMGGLIAQVPGLVAELTQCRVTRNECQPTTPAGKAQTVQLRLVLNANELAFLPLELATAPPGFAAAGQCLALQTEVPLCITREVRRASSVDVQWRRPPKILFAFAHPGSDVPYQQHLLALRAAVEPWVRLDPSASKEDRRAAVAAHLTVLPRASVQAITNLCAREAFTHVHLLAHGVPYQRGDDRRFGLALHDGINPLTADIVDGERLAAAVRPHLVDRSECLATPLAVTIASCDSGNTGSVIGAGASVAHELHLRGIPLVVASQFPLTVQGSIVTVDVLYKSLLWGHDPRVVLDDLRRRLKALVPTSHDWASIVAYAALPADIAQQCSRFALDQARNSIQAALWSADTQIASLRGSGRREEFALAMQRLKPVEYLLEKPLHKLQVASKHLEYLLETKPEEEEAITGLLAATEKRVAELYMAAANTLKKHQLIEEDDLASPKSTSRVCLERSRVWYERTFAANRTESWALVQELALELVLDERNERLGSIDGARSRSWSDRWQLARLMAEQDLNHGDRLRRLWARGNLVELHLLAQLWPNGLSLPANATDSAAEHQRLALHNAEHAIEESGPEPIELASIRRQIRRYTELFPSIAPHTEALRANAKLLDDVLKNR